MKITAYLLMWNEIDMVKLVVSYYQDFCDRIVIMDNHSTDGSAELAVSLGCEVIPFGSKLFDDDLNRKCKNEVWKGNSSDWVIVADFDEILYNSYDPFQFSMREYLGYFKAEGITIIKTIGWQIMSDEMPSRFLTEETNGFRFDNYSKAICFNPQAITEINYGPGAHECSPVGVVNWSAQSLYVLHYKHIGGVQRTIDRYKLYQKRMSKKNRQMGWGCHYAQSPAKLKQEWEQRMLISHPLL